MYDYGVENIEVARYMIHHRGVGRSNREQYPQPANREVVEGRLQGSRQAIQSLLLFGTVWTARPSK